MKRILFPIITLFLTVVDLRAQTLHVGAGQPYATLPAAAADAEPGDTILIHGGTYPGGIYIENLQGTPAAWIHIRAVEGDTVIYRGGTNAWQFTDAAYLHIYGIIFREQTGNGVNFDDGGTYDTPAHHVIFETCEFRDINAAGNNDLLKLSGVDSFEVRHCYFLNGAAGGSGIDMVGCHDSVIRNCYFENLGSNSIQAKGGTRNIRIEANHFRNGGARAVNLGGSTGLAFFRPIDAPYEAADLKVYSNIFMGSEAPIAFVGTTGTEVVNNTIFLPGKWVLRILQETVDPDRFAPCGNNTFRNNIVYLDNAVNVTCNIGPNTAPETFTFSNNLWFHSQNPNWPGPVLPVEDTDQIVGEDPRFESPTWDWSNFILRPESPAIGVGYPVAAPAHDVLGFAFLSPRSIGAIEGGEATAIQIPYWTAPGKLRIWPSPATEVIRAEWDSQDGQPARIRLFGTDGRQLPPPVVVWTGTGSCDIRLHGDIHGLVIVVLDFPGGFKAGRAYVN
jgi:hypothetical protein